MTKRFAVLLGVALGALLMSTLALRAVAGPSAPPLPPSATHAHRTPSAAEQDHATGGPFITNDQAVKSARAVGVGPSVLLSSALTTVAQATRELGFRAASNFVGDDRAVFLVELQGPYRPAFWFAGRPPIFDRYYVVLDATSGRVLATGELKLRAP